MKIPPRRIPSDDCIIAIGRKIENGEVVEAGETYNVHEGEWVEVVPVLSVARFIYFSRVLRGGGLVPEKETDGDDEPENSIDFDKLIAEIADRLVGWNWTDLHGEPLPQPHNNPEVIRSLSVDEIIYLVGILGIETQEERKNA